MKIPPYFQLNVNSIPAPEAVVQRGAVRFTVLSERMIRMEYHPDGLFEDRPSQVFWYREQPVPDYEVNDQDGELIIKTAALQVHYQEGQVFTAETLWIEFLGTRMRWRFGMEQKDNLFGTTRTLDMTDGAVPLEPGLLSRRGWTVVDDSASLVFNADGWLTERQPGGSDIYFWAYGKNYRQGMAEYYRVAGKPGLVPRWALGNWWSRFWDYTDDELKELVQDFCRHEIPLGVCIMDMDWHLTETGNGCSGWTGYTWNQKFFPDPVGFIRWLHGMGLKTGLNLHPAEGIWPHEEAYPQMAQAMGIDPSSRQPVRFDIENPVFAKAYFEYLHHPKEEEGIDFWWMDWQQGNPTRLAGLNLLWWINHLHYLDAGRDKSKRSFLFSRWGGLGNHRYPIGFSGDTFVTWDSLAFQPYMTATAANVGYSWWSHDIGGHMGGTEDGELYSRWVQYGVFSPILRLHSTKNAYHERRPWGFDANVKEAASLALMYRHRLIPYIYSMAWKDHQEGLPLVRPMYHLEPERDEAYACPNVYTFGTELVAAPFTTPMDQETRLARQVVWLPGEGSTWYGLLDHQVYAGGKWHAVYGGLKDIPVFARQGAILPLAPEIKWGGMDIPSELELHFFPGAANRFELFEDDGETQAYQEGQFAITAIEAEWDQPVGLDTQATNRLRIRICPARGATQLLPAKRKWLLVCHAIQSTSQLHAWVNGEARDIQWLKYDPPQNLLFGSVELAPEDELLVEVTCEVTSSAQARAAVIKRLAEAFHLETETRGALVKRAQELVDEPGQLAEFVAGLTQTQLRALLETLMGAGLDFRRVGGKNGPARVVAWNTFGRPEIGFLYSVDRAIVHQPDLRYSGTVEFDSECRIFWPEKELGRAKALWALNYGSLLRVEETL